MGKKKRWKKILKAGLRSTAPRVAVLQLYYCASGRPLSHGEVLETLGHDDWDQTTLYRNLLKLEEAKQNPCGQPRRRDPHYEYIRRG